MSQNNIFCSVCYIYSFIWALLTKISSWLNRFLFKGQANPFLILFYSPLVTNKAILCQKITFYILANKGNCPEDMIFCHTWAIPMASLCIYLLCKSQKLFARKMVYKRKMIVTSWSHYHLHLFLHVPILCSSFFLLFPPLSLFLCVCLFYYISCMNLLITEIEQRKCRFSLLNTKH